MGGYFWRAWPLCGLLDLLYAAVLTAINLQPVAGMLRTVASGPFGPAANDWGAGGAALGFCVHFAIMAVMVAVYGLLVRRGLMAKLGRWWLAGILYGLALYLVMYWIVLPLRWPATQPVTDPTRIATALFPHIVLIGLPMAWIARRYLNKEMA